MHDKAIGPPHTDKPNPVEIMAHPDHFRALSADIPASKYEVSFSPRLADPMMMPNDRPAAICIVLQLAYYRHLQILKRHLNTCAEIQT